MAVTKKDLRDFIKVKEYEQLSVITDEISEEFKKISDSRWEELIVDPETHKFLSATSELYRRLGTLPDEFLIETQSSRSASVLERYAHETLYSGFEKNAKGRLRSRVKANDRIVELRKRKNEIAAEYAKLGDYINTHTAIQAEKFFRSAGLDLPVFSETTQLEVVNINKNLLWKAPKPKEEEEKDGEV